MYIEDLIDTSPTNETHSFEKWFVEMQRITYEKSGDAASNNLAVLNHIKPSLCAAYHLGFSIDETLIVVNDIGTE